MSIIGTLERRMSLGPMDDSWYQPGGWFYGGVGPTTKSGSGVSEATAMRLSVVWCCVKILAEDSASLPLHLYRRLPGGGKERATDHPLYALLHDQPNPEMSAMSFRETFASHLVSWGNGYAEKEFGKGKIGGDRLVALWPITPNRVTPYRDEQKQVRYRITMGTGPNVHLPRRQILHCPGLSFNGLIGYSPIGAARESIGLGMSLEEFGALYFGHGLHPGVIVSHPGKLDAQTHANLKTSLTETYSGLGKSHRLMLLEEGLKIEKVGIPNDDAQFLESRKFQNIDIGSRIFRLPPQMYGEYDKASTYASAEQFAIDYVTKTLRSWLVRLEQAYNMHLLTPQERGEYFFEHLVDGLLRGDLASRYTAYAVGRNNGWLNGDQICEFENLNPMPNGLGKIYLVQGAMIPLDQAGKNPIKALPAPAEPIPKPAKSLSRSGLESAYVRLFADAIGRITRKEAQRVAWIRKNAGDLEEFYRELPEYIRRQILPACQSLCEGLMAVDGEARGINYNGATSEAARFASLFLTRFAADYIDASRALAESGADWAERDAETIAAPMTAHLAEAFMAHLEAFTALAGRPV